MLRGWTTSLSLTSGVKLPGTNLYSVSVLTLLRVRPGASTPHQLPLPSASCRLLGPQLHFHGTSCSLPGPDPSVVMLDDARR